jgi:hypothetical protein
VRDGLYPKESLALRIHSVSGTNTSRFKIENHRLIVGKTVVDKNDFVEP